MADFPDSTTLPEISRPIVEAEIELLIDLLDQLDADPDLEDNADFELTGDEEPLHGAPEQQTGSWRGLDPSAPSSVEGEELELGWTEMEGRSGRYGAAGRDVYEPSLGSTGSLHQGQWSDGGTDDTEDGHDGREPDVDDEPELGWTYLQTRTDNYSVTPWLAVTDGEPSLGSTNGVNQIHWAKGRNDDAEEQCDDEGAVDTDREPDQDGPGDDAVVHLYCSPTKTMFLPPPQ